MKHTFKNLLAVLLAVFMLFSILPITAFAEDTQAETVDQPAVSEQFEQDDQEVVDIIDSEESGNLQSEPEESAQTQSDESDDETTEHPAESLDDLSETEDLEDESELTEELVEAEMSQKARGGVSRSAAGPIRIRETQDYYTSLEDAVDYANQMNSTTIEILDDISISNDIIITSTMTILSIEGAHSVAYTGGHIKVNGGTLTLGEDSGDSLTFLGSISVLDGSIHVKETTVMRSSGTVALLLSGPGVSGSISGGYFTAGDTPLSLENGATLSEISGGTFVGRIDAVHITDQGTRIDLISGGSFYQTDNTVTLHGHAVFVQNYARIGLISGGYFEATRNCGLVVIRAGWVDEISGGAFVAKRNGTTSTDKTAGIWIEGEITTTGIGTISGGHFTGPNFGVLLIRRNALAKIETISGGVFEGTVALQNDNSNLISRIMGGTITGNQGMLNVGTIEYIGGNVQITGKTSYGIFNYMGGTIKVIDGGTITSNSSYGIANSGTIDLISDGTIIGTYAIYNTGMNSGRLNTITGGVFWGKSNVAITLAYDLNLEPNLSAQKGFGRYWGKDGVIFNNESRVKYPGSYFMSTRTEAVDGLSGVAFKYLTLSEATYEVTFVTAGGKFSDDTTSTIRYVAPPEIKVGMQNMPTIPTREGYYFYGWEDDDGYIFTGITEVRRNILVTALWQAVSYTIEYDANGGTGYMEDQLVSYDENVTLNTNTFIRQGYSFLGWNTEPDGSGTDYSDNQNFIWNQKDNLTLYAQWEANIYTVECMANGGIGSMLVQEATYGQDLTLDDNAYIKTGYTFIGWTTEQDGTGSEYVDGYSFTPWSLTENLVLYAQWQANTYTVSYLANGGVGEMSDDTTAYNNDFTLKANTFTRTGYTFKGWNTKADGSGDTYSDLHSFTPWDLDDSLELYAVWEANSYSVTYIANGGTGTMAADSVTYLANYAVRANAFTRSGYTFKNWNTQANGGGISYNAGGTIYIMGNLTLYAQWNEVVTPVEPTYSVSYLPGTHGTFAPLTISELTFGAATPASPIVTGQTGWIFTGWSPVRTATVTGNTTYTALWVQEPQTDDNFVVRFIDWNGNLLKSETVENGGAATAPSDPTRNGYEFTGWDREFDNITSDLTVTAQYKSIPQEVVGGTGEPTDETPEPPTNEDPDGNDESNHTTSEPEEYTQQEVLDIIKSEGIPTLTIGNLEIPLAAGSAMSKFVWALLNLILTLAGLIYAAVIIVRGAIEKRQDEYYDDEYQTEEDNQKPRRRLIPLFISVIMGIFGMILFLLTEDLTRLMVLVDRWTIVNALILVIEIVASSLAFRKQKEANDQEETDLHDMRAVGK